MTNITIQSIDSTLVIDSRLIAAELGINHKSFKETVRTYQADFEEFGTIAPVSGESTFGRPETFYYLNEDQSYLALTYSNNSTQVRQAKINLVKAFKIAREALAPKMPVTMIEYVEAHLAALKEAEATKLLLAAAEEKVAELEPKAEIFDVIANSGKLLSFSEAAKIINAPGLGRNNLMRLLRNKKVLQIISDTPYQQYINQGYFEVIESYTMVGVKLTTKVTQKGLSYLIRLLKKEGHEVPSKVNAA
jgi:anti-repressor protein